MRDIRRVLFLVDGPASPKVKLKAILVAGANANGYTLVEYPIDSSGDAGFYFKITKD